MAALAALLLTSSASARPQDVKDGTIRVNTRLVQVNVVVRDKNGSVANLTKADFTLLDEGKPQRIDVFSVSTSKPAAVPAVVPGRGVVSNLLNAEGESPGSATLVLFDLINVTNDSQQNLSAGINAATPRSGRSAPPKTVGNAEFGAATAAIEDQRDAIKQLLDYLRTIRPGDRVALYVLCNELSVIQDFTGDTAKLLRAAEKLRAMDAAGVEVRTLSQLSDLLEPPPVSTPGGAVYIQGPDFANAILLNSAIQRANATADALQSIARHLSGFPGRKNLVWMTAGFPFIPEQLGETATGGARANIQETPDNFGSQLHRASKALNDANVALYPVDIQGLRGGYPEVMLRLADATGGRVAQHTNDLKTAVQTAVADGEVSYTLGFYPSPERFDGKAHDLKVKVNRKGVEVRNRSTYDAVADPGVPARERQTVIAELLGSPLDASEIGMVAVAEADKSVPGTFKVAISIDATRLRLEEKSGRYTAALSIASRLESSKSKTVQVATMPVSLSESQYQDVRQHGLMIQRTVQSPSRDRLRIVVQDQGTGLSGSVWLPLNP
jgi:VWFA-related protein